MKSRTRPRAAAPRSSLLACSSGGGATPSPRRRTAAVPAATSPSAEASSRAERRAGRAHGLRRRVAEGRTRRREGGVRGRQPGHDDHGLDRLVVRARDPDRAGRPGRRLPVGRHDEPEEARRRRASRRATPVDFAGNKLTIIVPNDNPAGITSPADLAKPGPEGHRRGRRGPDHEVRDAARHEPRRAAGYPADFAPPTPRTSPRRRTTSRRSSARSSSARATPGSSTSPTRRRPTRSTRSTSRPTANVPATYAGVVVKASPNQDAATAFLDWFAEPGGPGDPPDFGFLPPAVMTDAVGGAPLTVGRALDRPRGVDGRRLGERRARRHRRPVRGLPGAADRHARRPVVLERLARSDRRLVGALTALALSLATTSVSLASDDRVRAAAGVRSGPALVPRQVARRGDRRPADRAAAGRRRARAAARLRPSRRPGRPDAGGRASTSRSRRSR